MSGLHRWPERPIDEMKVNEPDFVSFCLFFFPLGVQDTYFVQSNVSLCLLIHLAVSGRSWLGVVRVPMAAQYAAVCGSSKLFLSGGE